jgi:hypothetical protein
MSSLERSCSYARKSVVGVTNWSGEGVGAQVPMGVARATRVDVE